MSKAPTKPQRRSRAKAKAPSRSRTPARPRCVGITAKGKRCRRFASDGAEHCPVHLGAPIGRPSKLDEETANKIVQILSAGGYVETAAAAAGISKQTLYNWLDRGDPEGGAKEDEPFREFRKLVDQARAQGETRNVGILAVAAQKDWKAAAWMLERQFPERWAGPRGRRLDSSIHPDDFAAGESSDGPDVVDDQVDADGRAL